MAGATPILALPYPELDDTADVPRDVKALADALDTQVSTLDTRVDTIESEVSTIAVTRKAILTPGEESVATTSTNFAWMPTPDRVSVAVPASSLLRIHYLAQIRGRTSANGVLADGTACQPTAGLYLNESPVTGIDVSNTAWPSQTTLARSGAGSGAIRSQYHGLFSTPNGLLIGLDPGYDPPPIAGLGMVLGTIGAATADFGSSDDTVERAGGMGGPTTVIAPTPGTYTVGVKFGSFFAASASRCYVRNRFLYVEVVPFEI